MNQIEQSQKIAEIDRQIQELQRQRRDYLDTSVWMYSKNGTTIAERKYNPHPENPNLYIDFNGRQLVLGSEVFATRESLILYWKSLYEEKINHHRKRADDLEKDLKEFLHKNLLPKGTGEDW